MENSLPKGWVEISLQEVLETLQSGSRPKGGVRGIMNGIPSIGGEHLDDDGGFKFENIKFIPLKFADSMNRGKIFINDILIVKDGATTGKTSYVDENFPYKTAFVNEHVFIVRAYKGLSSKFIYWYLRSKEGNSRVMENFKGSAQGGINQTFSTNTIVPIAPISEQQRIVQKLDALMERVELNRKRLDKIPSLLKRFRRSVLAAAVSGKLTKEWRVLNNVLENWANVQLIDLITEKPKNGYSAKPVLYQTPFKVLTLTATTSGKFISEHFKYFDEEIAKDSTFWVKPNDILIQRGNTIEYVGVSAIYEGKQNQFIYPDLMMRVRANSKVLTKYLYLTLSAENARAYLRERATGTAGTMPKINQPTLMSLPILLPSVTEQKEITLRVDQLLGLIDKIESRYTKSKAQLDKLTQSILTKAFRGQLVPQNPEDEPVEKLLEKIKAAKDTLKERKTAMKVSKNISKIAKHDGIYLGKDKKGLSYVLKAQKRGQSFDKAELYQLSGLPAFKFLPELNKAVKSGKLKITYIKGVAKYIIQ